MLHQTNKRFKSLVHTHDEKLPIFIKLRPLQMQYCMRAAANGYLNILIYLKSIHYKWNVWTCTSAARHGHLELLKWAREHGCNWNEWTCIVAAQNGHLEVLQWAFENGCNCNLFKCREYGAKYPEIIEWINTELEKPNVQTISEYKTISAYYCLYDAED